MSDRFCLAALGLALMLGQAHAADTTSVRVGATQTAAPTAATTTDASRQINPLAAQARMWNITLDEMTRAQELMRFRSAFTNTNLSPIEVLGIHARNDAERRHYADLFARIMRDDAVRVLAFQEAYTQAFKRQFGAEPVLDFGKNKLPRSFFCGGE